MKTHMIVPGERAYACGADWKTESGTAAEPVVSCQRCIAWNVGREDGREGITLGMTYDNDPESPRSVAYDNGRTFGESERRLRAAIRA